ncbi:response regulator transcription factor [Umezawaea endophytica]|uniref:Response regulator transcription factor n=1 Tax=Umezawaea endophytica TaxID=1654476 RepID=A0A9X3A1B7_9PSEU|nr:response regulator transcription factor [Umezawaea endophytica]MCS7479444.1 response regulator transcription factor [Umezawaea endophytica]
MREPAKILVVEDNPEISYLIELALVEARLDVRAVGDGDGALAAAQDWEPDVVLLDLGIPGPDGVEVCRRLRRFSNAYVLMLTGRAEEVDKLIGLSVGADDYLTKPFSPRELLARVQAMLRRPRDLAGSAVVETGLVAMDLAAREVRVAGEVVGLTKIEFDLLAALMEDVRQVHTRDQLRERVWGGSRLADDHAVDVHMSNLRRKLSATGEAGMITTVRGVGYRYVPGGGP